MQPALSTQASQLFQQTTGRVVAALMLATRFTNSAGSVVQDSEPSKYSWSLQALIVQYESTVAAAATSAVREGRAHGFMQSRGKAITAPALSAQKGVLRELLTITDLQSGIRYGAQLQTAKVLVVAIEALLAQLASSASGVGGAGGGGGAAARAREPSSGRLTSRRAQSKGGKRRQGMTKRQRRAYDELARGGLVGLGAVDPSPQRTTVAVAACVCLLL